MNKIQKNFMNNYNNGNIKKNNELLANSFKEYFTNNDYMLHSPAPDGADLQSVLETCIVISDLRNITPHYFANV